MTAPQAYTGGKYAGSNLREIAYDGILLSQTIYKKDTASDWHFHENTYFALILNGGSTEVRKKQNIECLPGQAYFYNWDDAHRNQDYQEASKNFNVEFDKRWLIDLGFDINCISGIIPLHDPGFKLLIAQILREYHINDESSALSINALSLQLVESLGNSTIIKKVPGWVNQVREILNDRWDENISLNELSVLLHIHPITIARYFPVHFGCTFGAYMRKLRIARAIPMIKTAGLSLTGVALTCGFADQSHFIRTFKEYTGFLPGDFRRI